MPKMSEVAYLEQRIARFGPVVKGLFFFLFSKFFVDFSSFSGPNLVRSSFLDFGDWHLLAERFVVFARPLQWLSARANSDADYIQNSEFLAFWEEFCK
jgi:hypothetical protein